MIKTSVPESPITHATLSLHRSNLEPEKVDISLKLIVTEVKVITRTINEAEVNPFLAKYGLSPLEPEELAALKGNSYRQITEVIEYTDVKEGQSE